MGVCVAVPRHSFWSSLPSELRQPPITNSFATGGAYARFDCPLVANQLRLAGVLPRTVGNETLLYTDTDVFFHGDPTAELLARPPPAFMAAADDVLGPGINSGVLCAAFA